MALLCTRSADLAMHVVLLGIIMCDPYTISVPSCGYSESLYNYVVTRTVHCTVIVLLDFTIKFASFRLAIAIAMFCTSYSASFGMCS